MELKKVVAIVRTHVLKDVEARLSEMRVKGIVVTSVMGYGEYDSFINPDWGCTHARIELYAEISMVDPIVEAILETAHVGIHGDGIVSVQPVERIFRILSRSEIIEDGM